MSYKGKIYRVHPDGLNQAKKNRSLGWRLLNKGDLVKVIKDYEEGSIILEALSASKSHEKLYLFFSGSEPTDVLSGGFQYLEEL